MLLDTLDRHTTLITVNRRLSRVLRSEFDRARLADGAVAWESPDILPYPAWLERCWNDAVAAADRPMPVLLHSEQDLSLWERAVSEHASVDGAPPLLQSADAARSAQAAWALLRAWDRRYDQDLGYSNAETRAFRVWARSYEALCRQGNWIDPASAGDRLVGEGLESVLGAGTRCVLLAGFDALTAQQQSLFTALSCLGVKVERWNPPAHDGQAQCIGFADQGEELEAAARWARQCVEDGASGPVGIVVPGLAALRHRVQAVFEDVFAPGSARPAAGDKAQAFNISLGTPLAAVQVVADALLCLRAMGGRLSLRDAGRWLLSPYLGGGCLSWRARLDAELRRIGEPHYTLERLAQLAERLDRPRQSAQGLAPDADGAAFARFLQGLPTGGVSAAGRRTMSEWAAQFSAWLVNADWPGRRALDSGEYQAVQAYRECLGNFAALTPMTPAVAFSQALMQLQRLAARQVFQARSAAAPVQILGVLEAVGVDYSHLWVSGLHHQAWPEPARPNPFLPVKLQRELGMPRASNTQQLAWARDWTARMLNSAEHVIVSYPRQIDDEVLRPSALITHVPMGQVDAVPGSRVPGDARHVHDQAPVMERIEDGRAPPVAAGRMARGGVSVFKNQAACPFRAFAVHRLAAVDVAVPESSLDPRVRGNLAHRVLELTWQALGGQSRLLSMTHAERADLIRDNVKRVLGEEARDRPQTLSGRLLTMEQQRLELLADAWLAIEAERSDFEVQAESSERVRVAGLPVSVRPDRIDRLSDGQIFLVDYKTGYCDPKDWFGERPDEPQLPVYALAMDDAGEGNVAGLAFGDLRPGKLGYRGLGGVDDLAPGVEVIAASRLHGAREATDWDAHKALWRERLSTLAQGYMEGDARVDPKTPGATCRYCGLHMLCRIHER